MSKWTPLQFPWRRGPMHDVDGPVYVTASRLSFGSHAELLAAAPSALRLWSKWGTVPDAVGLSMRVEPLRLASWTISVWATEAATRNFVDSAIHKPVMQRFSSRGVTGVESSWSTSSFDTSSAWARAIGELDQRE